MDEQTYQRLSEIHDRLIQVCACVNDKRDIETASRLLPIMDDLTQLPHWKEFLLDLFSAKRSKLGWRN